MQDKIIVFPELPPGDKVQLVTSDLPISLTSLIGREREVQALHALILRPDIRLLTLPHRHAWRGQNAPRARGRSGPGA